MNQYIVTAEIWESGKAVHWHQFAMETPTGTKACDILDKVRGEFPDRSVRIVNIIKL